VAPRESRIDGEGSAVATIGRMVYSIKDVTDRPAWRAIDPPQGGPGRIRRCRNDARTAAGLTNERFGLRSTAGSKTAS
jgi:hypothetical protein